LRGGSFISRRTGSVSTDGGRVPTATYRLQLGPGFGFPAAAALVDYLQALGVSHLYLSPVFQALAGSLHGYDVVDHSTLGPELGGEAEFHALSSRLEARGMGLLLDVVPNHMCVARAENAWWNDVLENGPSSPYARFFDVDWLPPKADLEGKVLLPILGDQYGRILENQELRVSFESGAFVLGYWDHHLPVAPRSWPLVLEPALERLRASLGPAAVPVLELESILTAIAHLPRRDETEPERVRERQREKQIIKRRLCTLAESTPECRDAIARALADFNGSRGDSRSFDRLEGLLADQAYRLSYWRVASDEINYRRFFDVNELAALRVEVPEVFAAVHALPFRLFQEGTIDGFRIDHVDGLYDPLDYLARLPAAAWIVVEKILVDGERLRDEWPVHGSTGYEFLNLVGGLFVDPAGLPGLDSAYEAFVGQREPYEDVAYESRKLVLDVSLSSELTVLARRLDRISERHRFSRDFTLNSLQAALGEVIANFPVYRSYIRADAGAVSAADREHVETAVRLAKRRNPALSDSLFDFVASVLLLQDPDGLDEAARRERREFVMRFQQITGPVMAKGVEDTAFYRHHPLASRNEVGGDPAGAPADPPRFHRENTHRADRWPFSLLATSTHDTKRSEDVRARLAVLSEVPGDFASALGRWRELGRPHRALVDEAPTPDARDEHLFFQTLVGTWPLGLHGRAPEEAYTVRIQAYMRKALREAKLRTSWVSPNLAYEAAVERW
jgi:(1->4)-alpha-D-glucan 1-alpha-D-glucosylmutase